MVGLLLPLAERLALLEEGEAVASVLPQPPTVGAMVGLHGTRLGRLGEPVAQPWELPRSSTPAGRFQEQRLVDQGDVMAPTVSLEATEVSTAEAVGEGAATPEPTLGLVEMEPMASWW